MSKGTTQFSDAPAPTPAYKSIVERAKARAAERPGPLQNTPRFDQLPDRNSPLDVQPVANPERQSMLSEKTVDGLKAISSVVAKAKAAEQSANDADDEMQKPEEVAEAPKELTDDEKLRAAIEARLSPIDIGQYLVSGGEVVQLVPIVPGKLEVRFRTVTEYKRGG